MKRSISFFLKRQYFTIFRSKRIASRFVPNYDKRRVNVELLFNPGKNIGDTLNPVVLSFILSLYNLSDIGKRPHTNLSMVGSLIGFCQFNCHVWGSGILSTRKAEEIGNNSYIKRLFYAVRGPLTRNALVAVGYKVPEVYGDPAILLPLIYQPKSRKKEYALSVIRHYIDKTIIPGNIHAINVLTDDYKGFIDEICKSKLVISSSLHGIIIAESYGVPAIWLRNPGLDEFKYLDWYLSTRTLGDIVSADTLEEAINLQPSIIPMERIEDMRKKLIEAFPKHLFKKADKRTA